MSSVHEDQRKSRAERFKLTVDGFIRRCDNAEEIPKEIEALIFMFYFVTMDSKILNDKQIDTLIKLLPDSNMINNLQLIFRGSEDGHDRKSFCNKCDRKSPLFMIIKGIPKESDDKCMDEWIFGGYSNCAMNRKQRDLTFIEDETLKSFIFMLESPVEKYNTDLPHKWYLRNKENAVYNYHNGFGYGNDWWVAFSDDNYNRQYPCYGYLNLGNSYDVPKPYTMITEGCVFLKIVEYEVWHILE